MILGDEEVLSLEISVDALSLVEVIQSSRDIDRKRESKSPRERQLFVVDVRPEIPLGNEFGDDEDSLSC